MNAPYLNILLVHTPQEAHIAKEIQNYLRETKELSLVGTIDIGLSKNEIEDRTSISTALVLILSATSCNPEYVNKVSFLGNACARTIILSMGRFPVPDAWRDIDVIDLSEDFKTGLDSLHRWKTNSVLSSKHQENEEIDPVKELINAVAGFFIERFKMHRLLVNFIGVLVVFLGPIMFWKWGELLQTPIIGSFLRVASQPCLPKVDNENFVLALAVLENDPGNNIRKNIAACLDDFFRVNSSSSSVGILEIERMISLDHSNPNARGIGHKKAREYLSKTGANIIIWGQVVRTKNKEKIKLYFTHPGEYDFKSETSLFPFEFELPENEWSNLLTFLNLIWYSELYNIKQWQNSNQTEEIELALGRAEKLLNSKGFNEHWAESGKSSLHYFYGTALLSQYRIVGNTKSLTLAQHHLEKSIEKMKNDQDSDLSIAATINLGLAYLELGEVKSKESINFFQQASVLFRSAYNKLPRDDIFARLVLMNNLGKCLIRQGERSGHSKELKEAEKVLKDGLNLTQGKYSKIHGKFQANLGIVYHLLAFRNQKDPAELLIKSITLLEASLNSESKIVEKDLETLRIRKNNLATALADLGALKREVDYLKRAEKLFGELEEGWNPSENLYKWATIQQNQAELWRLIGELTSDIEYFSRGEKKIEATLRIIKDSVPRIRLSLLKNRGANLNSWGEQLQDISIKKKCFQESLKIYELALKDARDVCTEYEIAVLNTKAAEVLTNLARLSNEENLWERAEGLLKEAFDKPIFKRNMLNYANGQHLSGIISRDRLGEFRDLGRIHKAIIAFRDALKQNGLSCETEAKILEDLAVALEFQGDQVMDPESYCNALDHRRKALACLSEQKSAIAKLILGNFQASLLNHPNLPCKTDLQKWLSEFLETTQQRGFVIEKL